MIIRESSAFETDPAVFNRPYHTSERAGASNLLWFRQILRSCL